MDRHPEDGVGQEDNPVATGVSRGQHQLHILPEDWSAAADVIDPLLERVEREVMSAQLVVLASDAEAAAGIAGRIAPSAADRHLRILGATDTRRSARLQRSLRADVIVAPTTVLVDLVQSTAVKLDAVRAVVLAWLDELDEADTRALETIMSELPKEATRIILVNTLTPAVEQLVERYARRARRVPAVTADHHPPVSLSYVAVSEPARVPALRRVLDALDPESAFIVARHPESRRAVGALLQSLGYGGEYDSVRLGDTPEGVGGGRDARVMILFDMPESDAALRALAAERPAARIVALVTPRQIPALRRLAGGNVSPLVLPEAAMRAQTREEGLRQQLRELLSTGQFSRELIALEPLLTEFDGAEVAAAAVRLLESERSRPAAGPSAPSAPALTRLYLNVGSMDNVRPGDLVGAITNEAGVSKAELGKVDVRERHSTVEVATPVANAVISKLTGVSIRGRRVLARVDEERKPRGRPPRMRT